MVRTASPSQRRTGPTPAWRRRCRSQSSTSPRWPTQSLSTNENTATSGILTATDADNNLLTFAIGVSPAHGVLSGFSASSGAFTYTPTTGYYGGDSFTFTATDGTNTSAAAAVSLTVVDNITPVANAQSLSTNENTATSGTPTATDADGNNFRADLRHRRNLPAHGTLTSFERLLGSVHSSYTPTTPATGAQTALPSARPTGPTPAPRRRSRSRSSTISHRWPTRSRSAPTRTRPRMAH